MLRNLSFFKRAWVEFTVSLSILLILNGKSNASCFLALVFIFFNKLPCSFLMGSLRCPLGTRRIIPSLIPFFNSGFKAINSCSVIPKSLAMLEIVSLGRTTYSSRYFLVLTACDFGVSSFTLVSATVLNSGFPAITNFNPTGKSLTIAGFNRSNSCMVIPYFLEIPYLVSLGSMIW